MELSEESTIPSGAVTPKKNKRSAVIAYLVLGLLMPLLCVFLALALGVPTPSILDGFSYQLMADTFALGRVVNPEHPLSQFFQTFYVIQHNGIYVSKYFPGIGVQLLVGKWLGHPLIGVWLTVGLFGVSLLFFLRQFFSESVALIVSLLCSLQFMVLSSLGHNYLGGSLMALAGVWALGGGVLAVKRKQLRYSWISAAGIVVCILTRPFEGFFFMVPVTCWQLLSLLRSSKIFGWRRAWRLIAPMIIGVCFGLLTLGIYNQRVTGNWTTLPYNLYAKIYAPYGVLFLGEHRAGDGDNSFFESLPAPFHQMRDDYESMRHERIEHFFRVKYEDACYIGSTLFPLSISWMLLLAVASKAVWKNGLGMVCLFTMGMRLFPLLLSWSSKWLQYSTAWIFPLAVLAAFGLEWFLSQQRTRRLAEILSIATITWLAVIYLLSFDKQLDLRWKVWTIYINPQMQARNTVKQSLEQIPGKHLLFVQYSSSHSWGCEWVYNGPEIDAQKIVWAHDLGTQEDRRLMNYYPNRDIWLVTDPDSPKITLEHWNQSKQQFEFARSFDK